MNTLPLHFIFTVLFAFVFAIFSALHGIEIDQMIMYQSALNLLKGQVLYKDFYIPHGPLGSLLMAFFLKISSTGGMAILLGSGILNALATFSAWDITRKVTPHLLYPFYAAVLTAIWFLPVFGTIYNDHLAYCCVLLFFVLSSRLEKYPFLLAPSAFFLVLAFHFKQTVGVPALLAIYCARFLVFGKEGLFSKKHFQFIAFYCLGHLLVFSLIYFFSDFSKYFLYTFIYPLSYASSLESTKQYSSLLFSLVLPFGINSIFMVYNKGLGQLSFYPVVLVVYLGYWVGFREKLKKETRFALWFFILSTLFCSALLGRLFAHLFFGAGGILAISLSAYSDKRKKLYSPLLVSFLAVLGIIYVNHSRPFFSEGNPFYSNTDLRPIRIDTSPLASSSQKVIAYIKDKPGSLAVFTDASFLISPALRIAALNPPVYYHEGLTIPVKAEERKIWQEAILSQIENKKVDYLVVSRPIEKGFRRLSAKRLPCLPVPLIEKYLSEHYQTVLEECFFQLLKRKN